nr:hypothetical protein Iba_chr09eCG12240 [Ipomoea batatas]
MIDTQLPFSASRHSPVSLSSSRWASRWSSSQRASATSLFPAKTRRSSGMAKQAPTFPFPPLLHLQRRNENGPLPLGGSSWSSEMDGSSNDGRRGGVPASEPRLPLCFRRKRDAAAAWRSKLPPSRFPREAVRGARRWTAAATMGVAVEFQQASLGYLSVSGENATQQRHGEASSHLPVSPASPSSTTE